jgi:hypothetical protein
MRPNRVAPLIPVSFIDPNSLESLELLAGGNLIDGKYLLGAGSTSGDRKNVFADYYAGGNSKFTSRQFQFDAGLNFNLSSLLDGLSFHTQYGIDYATSYITSYNNQYATYEPQWFNYNGPDVIGSIAKFDVDRRSGVQNINGSTSRQTISSTSYFKYVANTSGPHSLTARLVATGFQQTISGTYHRTGNANLGLEANYNLSERFFATASAGIVRSAKLIEGKKNGISTAITLGWDLTKEDFIANSSVVDDLSLNVSASALKTDIDISGYYDYAENFDLAGGQWWGWLDGASERSTNARRSASKDLGFVKRNEFSASVRTALFDRLITANASFFVSKKDGIAIQPRSIYPLYFFTYFPERASFIPFENFNNEQRSGVDFNVNVNKNLGELALSVGVVGMYFNSKATRVDEIFVDKYRERTGKPLNGLWGLQSAGFYKDQADIENSPANKLGGTLRPGDIKYVDQNNDGLIDERDEVFLGKTMAPFTGGLNLTAKYKGFTLFVLGTANFGAYAMKNEAYHWIYGQRKYSEVVRDRWTPATHETATYPRLTTEASPNNFRSSDFWMYKTNRFNLARVQLTYDLPQSLIGNSIFGNVSVYVSGSNILTISKERELLEMNVGSAPQTRFFNLGLRAGF